MKGAVQIARFAGIPVKLHWTFGLLLLWVVYTAISSGLNPTGVLLTVSVVAAIFACVVMHEYGHALTARRFGVHTYDIILSPIGGIARLDHIPERPRYELLIALAGPAVNLVIAILLLSITGIVNHRVPQLFSSVFWSLQYEQSIVLIIAKINLILVAFNMVPAFPMDGGRVLRALLSMRFDRYRATLYASFAGRGFAAMFFLYGIIHPDLILSLIGAFIFFAAGREQKMAQTGKRLKDLTAGQICNSYGKILIESQILGEALTPSEIENPKDYLVADDKGDIVGVLFREFIGEADARNLVMHPVRVLMSDLFKEVDVESPLADVIDLFKKQGYRLVPVYDGSKYIGSIHRKRLEYLIRGGDPDLLDA